MMLTSSTLIIETATDTLRPKRRMLGHRPISCSCTAMILLGLLQLLSLLLLLGLLLHQIHGDGH